MLTLNGKIISVCDCGIKDVWMIAEDKYSLASMISFLEDGTTILSNNNNVVEVRGTCDSCHHEYNHAPHGDVCSTSCLIPLVR